MIRKLIYASIFIAIILFIIFILYNNNGHKSYTILSTATAKKGSVKSYIVEKGVIKPQVGAEIEIGARATGTIEEMNVKVGDSVKRGQLIAEIDSREIKKQIAQTKEQIRIIEKEIELEKSTYPYQRNIYKQEVYNWRSQMETAKNKYEREIYLFNRGFSAKEELETLRSSYDDAKARLEQAKLELDRYDREHFLTLDRLYLELKQQKLHLDELEVRFSYTKIYSPIDGVVTQVAAEAGETIVTGLQVANLITIINPRKLEMWIYIDETDISNVKVGQNVKYSVDTYPDKTFQGVVDRINLGPEIFDNIVYYKAIVNIEEKTALLFKPEMTTQAKIMISEKENILVIPKEALKWDIDKYIVYKIIDLEKNIIEKVAVKVGKRGEDNAEILKGLKEGDKIAVDIKIENNG
ncbi:MAG: efflux RND transporter periplasmic adaptor subunit [Deferribacterota bacterium]|nr:efflux RND transporter periplasmic adaptor subunit [Deferribacterota bacterium]